MQKKVHENYLNKADFLNWDVNEKILDIVEKMYALYGWMWVTKYWCCNVIFETCTYILIINGLEKAWYLVKK